MNLIKKLRTEKLKLKFRKNSIRINCENCKFRHIDDAIEKPYCYPNEWDFLTVPCEVRYKKHYEQCLYLNGMISFSEMCGEKSK